MYDGREAFYLRIHSFTCWRLLRAFLLVHPLRLRVRRRLTRTLGFSASYQVRLGHRQHLCGASLLCPLAVRT